MLVSISFLYVIQESNRFLDWASWQLAWSRFECLLCCIVADGFPPSVLPRYALAATITKQMEFIDAQYHLLVCSEVDTH